MNTQSNASSNIQPLDVTARSIPIADLSDVLEKLPDWAVSQRATEVLRVSTVIPHANDMEKLVALMDIPPKPISALLTPEARQNAESRLISVLGVYPSGAVRTIGETTSGSGDSVSITLYDYLNLIDPDGDDPMDVSEVAVNLHIVGIFAARS